MDEKAEMTHCDHGESQSKKARECWDSSPTAIQAATDTNAATTPTRKRSKLVADSMRNRRLFSRRAWTDWHVDDDTSRADLADRPRDSFDGLKCDFTVCVPVLYQEQQRHLSNADSAVDMQRGSLANRRKFLHGLHIRQGQRRGDRAECN